MNFLKDPDHSPTSTIANEPADAKDEPRRRVFSGYNHQKWAFFAAGLVLYVALLALLYQDPRPAVSPETLLQATPVHTVDDVDLDNVDDLDLAPIVDEEPLTADILADLPRKEITRDGITVCVEKVVFERIYNVREFLESEMIPHREGKEREAFIRAFHDTRKVVRVFLSIKGPTPTGAEKTVAVQHSNFSPKYAGSQWKYGQDYWQKDIPGWTNGTSIMLEIFEMVDHGVKMEDIFPLSVTVKIRARVDETPIEFKLSGLQP